jgi:hypothetical protein
MINGVVSCDDAFSVFSPASHKNEKVSLPILFAGNFFTAIGQFVIGESPNQTTNNSGGDKSGNVNVWIKFSQDAFKIVCCGAIGGLIGFLIYQALKIVRKKISKFLY